MFDITTPGIVIRLVKKTMVTMIYGDDTGDDGDGEQSKRVWLLQTKMAGKKARVSVTSTV